LEAVVSHPNICKQIHLPLQSGSDRMLGLMNRTYTNKEYRALVDRIRTLRPEIVLTTDIICGFCGESDAEFAETYRLVEETRFHSAFIFKYSERKNTIAARQVFRRCFRAGKDRTSDATLRPPTEHFLRAHREYLKTIVSVLVEGNAKRSAAQGMGKSDGNITVIWDKCAVPSQTGRHDSLAIYDASSSTLYAERPLAN